MGKRIVCVECGKEFLFTEGEQRFYAEKGFDEPKRCKDCRDKSILKELDVRTSNYFENSHTFGAGTDVAGGLSVEHTYFVTTEDGRVVADCQEGRVDVTTDPSRVKFFSIKADAEHAAKILNKNNVVATVRVSSEHQRIRSV